MKPIDVIRDNRNMAIEWWNRQTMGIKYMLMNSHEKFADMKPSQLNWKDIQFLYNYEIKK